MGKLKINHAAVWVSIVLLHVLGFLWYGMLFQNQWMTAVGLDMATLEANPAGAGIGLLIGFSFVLLSTMTNDMFAKNPYFLSWITGGFSMVSLAIAGLILGALRKYEAA